MKKIRIDNKGNVLTKLIAKETLKILINQWKF